MQPNRTPLSAGSCRLDALPKLAGVFPAPRRFLEATLSVVALLIMQADDDGAYECPLQDRNEQVFA